LLARAASADSIRRGPGEQLVAGKPVVVREDARRHHELICAGAGDEPAERIDDLRGVADDVRRRCVLNYSLLGC
jgi:hypothetical protein